MSPAIEVRSVWKRFGPVLALDNVSTRFEPGEIHAVVGENGAGKSTLMGVLGGFVRPDSGQIFLNEKNLTLGNPGEASRAGIALVHQHFMLVPEFTVEENLSLARASEGGSLLSHSESERALKKGQALGWDFDRKAKVRDLSVGMQQRLEILKVLAADAQIIIFDEPTAVLRQEEVDELFRVLADLKRQGRTVILIAHKLGEVIAIADRITVLRKGCIVATALRSEVDAQQLAVWMLGEQSPMPHHSPTAFGLELLRVSDLVVQGRRGEVKVDRVTFKVHRSEILGIGGVDGNGQLELAEALAGIRSSASGTVRMEGRIVFMPPDRHRDGLALEMTLEENLLIEGHRNIELRNGPFLLSRRIRDWAERLKMDFQIAAFDVDIEARKLSGGNQQKIIVARALDARPDILVAVNPTRGLDIKATAFVRREIQEAAELGAAVVLFSTDIDELREIATRTLYMSAGRLFESDQALAYVGGSA